MKKPFLVLPCLLLLSLRAVADEPRVVLPAPPNGPAVNVPPAPGSAASVSLDFPNSPVLDLLVYYGMLTGQQVVCDNSVQGQVSVRTSKPVAREQAEAMIEQALFMNGFALVDSEDGSILKVIGLGKPPRSLGVPIYTSAADLPKRERVVSLVLNLRFADAQTMSGLLGAYSPPNAVTGFTPVGPHVVVISGPTSLLRRLLKIVEAMDVKEGVPAEKKAPLPGQVIAPRPALPPPTVPSKNDDDDDD